MPQYLNMMMVFGAACFAIMMLLVALGESTLPLFGGDRELAARVYKTVFVALSAGTVAGVAPAGMTKLADFGRGQVGESGDAPAFTGAFLWVFEHAQVWVFLFFVLTGIGLSIMIWVSEG